MQTELLLCLIPSPETEALISTWRSGLARTIDFQAGLPSLIPLAFLKSFPSFEQLRQVAAVAWTVPAIAPQAIRLPYADSLILPLDNSSWQGFADKCLDSMPQLLMSDSGLAMPIPLGPWFFIGKALGPTPYANDWGKLPEYLVTRHFSAVMLSLLRIRCDFLPSADLFTWEIMSQFRVKKSPTNRAFQ